MKAVATPMPVYCINLAERTDRWAHMEAEAAKAGISLIRVEACNSNDAESFDPPPANRRSLVSRTMTSVEVACGLSHRRTWKLIADSEAPAAVVLEDDVLLAPGFSSLLGGDWLPPTADLVRIEAFGDEVTLEGIRSIGVDNRRLGRLKSSQLGTGGYIVTRRGAEKLVQDQGAIIEPIDLILFGRRSHLGRILRKYQVVPAPVMQGMFADAGRVGDWAASTIYQEREHMRAVSAASFDGPRKTSQDRPVTARRRLGHWLRRPFRLLTGRRKVQVEFK